MDFERRDLMQMNTKGVQNLGGKPRAGVRARAKSARSELTDLEKNFCLNYVKQGCCNGAGAMEAAGSRGNYNTRSVQASKYLKMPKVLAELKRLMAKADERARKHEERTLVSVAERKAVLSDIIRANAGALRGVALVGGALVFEDESVRSAVTTRAQIVQVPDPAHEGKGPPEKVSALMIGLELSLADKLKAIAEMNKMDGVYKEGGVMPAEIHIHTGGELLAHDEQTQEQLADPELRVPILGSAADASRFRKADVWATLGLPL